MGMAMYAGGALQHQISQHLDDEGGAQWQGLNTREIDSYGTRAH